MSADRGVGRREFLKGAAAIPLAGACAGPPGPQATTGSGPPSGVALWGQDLGLGEAFRGEGGRTEVEAYVRKCADHGVSRVFAPGASAELVEAGAAVGVEVHPYKAVASHGGIRMYPAWSSNFMVPRFGTGEGRAILDAHRPIWSHPQRVESLSDFLRDHPEHRHRNRGLTDELQPYERVFLSPGLPGGRAEEARAFSGLLERSRGRGIQAEFVSINEDPDGVSTDGYEDSIAGAFREGHRPGSLHPPERRSRVGAVPRRPLDRHGARGPRRREGGPRRRRLHHHRHQPRSGRLSAPDAGLAHLGGRRSRRRDAPLVPLHHRPCDHRTALPPFRGDGRGARIPAVAEFSCYHPGSLQDPAAMMDAARAARAAGMDGLGIYRSHAVDQLEFWPLLEQMTRL